jgi:hypothetical protein
MMESDLDIDITREAVSDPDVHAIHHVNNLDELNALWSECEALQNQIDELYKIILKKA